MKGVRKLIVPMAALGLLAASTLPGHTAPVPGSPAPAQAALNHLLQNTRSPLPPGTRLLGVSVHDGRATANFNRALTDNFQGGDSQAAETVNVILRTLGRFPAVRSVQILEDGQIPSALGGLIVLSSPLPVIRPQNTAPTLYDHRVMGQGSSAHP